MRLHDFQQVLQDKVFLEWHMGKRNVLAVSPTGSGKCLGRDTPVIMMDGNIRAVQDVKPGDWLLGPDGQGRFVKSVTSGREPLYRVHQIKGDPYVINESHILSLKKTAETPTDKRAGEVVNIEVRDYLSRSDWFRHIHKGWKPDAIEFNEKKFIVEPYLIGIWLADGTARTPQITTAEPEVVSYLEDYVENHDGHLRFGQGRGCQMIYISGCGFHSELKQLDLLQNKHIPHIYKTGSVHQRLTLLAGYIDGDGHLSGGYYDCVVKQKALAEDIVFVARSLGFGASIKPVKKGIKATGFMGDYFRISITGDIERIPCLVPRRKASPRLQKKSVLVTGIRLEPLGEGDYFGFELAGPDRLFLLGDFTVTHNTIVKASVAARFNQPCVAIAHRQELVSQISLAFAKFGIYHRIIAPDAVIKFCIRRHIKEFGKSFHHQGSPVAVAGVDTINKRSDDLAQWIRSVRLWLGDEAHHFLPDNKWGKAVALFREWAFGLGVTATPRRTDGQPLSGVFNALVLGPTVRALIDAGHLSDYRIWSLPPSYYMNEEEDVSKTTGDYKPDALRKRAHGSKVVGDIVDTYLKVAPGELGITFVVSVEQAKETAMAFIQKGVPALALSGTSTDDIRQGGIDQFRRGDVKQLINVDLFDEGFDVPGASYCSMGRKTKSIIKLKQQMGRVLRVEDGKTHGKIGDHVGNCYALRCVPDTEFAWSLEGSKNAKTENQIKLKVCTQCYSPYEAFYSACPYCGHKEVPAERSKPEHVDGDLQEFDPALIQQLRGEIKRVDGPALVPRGVQPHVAKGIENRWLERQIAQQELRDCIAQWAGIRKHVYDRTDSQSYREFYHLFGIDIMSAQALGAPEARKLTETIREEWI